MTLTVEKCIVRLKETLTLPAGSIDRAVEFWRAQKNAFLEGAREEFNGLEPHTTRSTDGEPIAKEITSLAKQIRTNYLMSERLRYDFDQLHSYYSNEDRKKIIYVVDPHILLSYSEFMSVGAYSGFEFIENEWSDEGGEAEKRNFLLYLYSAIFRSGDLCILGPGRQQILDYFSYFREKAKSRAVEKNYISDRIGRYENLIDSLTFGTDTGNPSQEKLEQNFKRLVGSASTGEIYADLGMTRLLNSMSAGNFKNLYSSLQATHLPSAKIGKFWEVMGELDKHSEVLVKARSQADKAFHAYLDNTQFSEHRRPDFYRRNAAYHNRSTILEIHKYNTCLELCDINVEIRFLTNSPFIFSLMRPLEQYYNVPLIHTRTYFAYKNPGFFSEIKPSVGKVLSHSSAATRIIDQDKKITLKELHDLNKFAPPIRAIRDANAFGGVKPEAMEQFVQATRQSVLKLQESAETKKDEGLLKRASAVSDKSRRVIEYLSSEVEIDRDAAPSLLKTVVEDSDKSDELWRIFSDLASAGPAANHPHLAVKLVKNVGPSVELKRIICLPIKGSYRYIFGITNSDLLNFNALKDAGLDIKFKVIDINNLINIVDNSAAPQKGKNKALRFYIRAIHAASYRDWAFANHLANEAISAIEAVEGVAENSRFHFLKAEIFYLLHLSLRGLAESKFRGKRQLQKLIQSRNALLNAARSTAKAYTLTEKLFSSTEYHGTMTFRFALAYIGLCKEMLVVQKSIGLDFTADKIGMTNEPPFSDIQTIGPKKHYWAIPELEKLTSELLWNDPQNAVKVIFNCLSALTGQIKAKFLSEQESSADLFDADLWNFRKMRCHQMMFSTLQFINCELIYGQPPKIDLNSEIAGYRNSVDRYQSFVRSYASQANEDGITELSLQDAAPYAQILLLAIDAISNLEGDSVSQETDKQNRITARINAFEKIKSLEGKLDPLGLPRTVSWLSRKKILEGSEGEIQLDEHMKYQSKNMLELSKEMRREFSG